MGRRCEKCASDQVIVERSPMRLTLHCTACKYKIIKPVANKGFG
jgi:ribosomal protein S27E